MITEIVQLEVKPGQEAPSQQAVLKAVPLITGAEGCHGVELRHCIETPARFLLMVRWETVAHHTEKYIGSSDWKTLLGTIGCYLAADPDVRHFEAVL